MQLYDYLIVGQGLAGSLLSYALLQRKQRVLVVDHPDPVMASRIAAGLFNPITGRNMNLTWLAEPLFDVLHTTYTELEDILKEQFFYPTPIYFPFDSQEKQNDWTLRSSTTTLAPFVGKLHLKDLYPSHIKAGYGGLETTKSGYLDIKKLLVAYRNFLVAQDVFLEDRIFPEELEIGEEIHWKEISASNVVLCDGLGGLSKHFFPFLDFRPVRGELLTIHIGSASFSHIINRNGWLLPLQEKGLYKFGATYDNRHLENQVTEDGKQELEKKLNALLQLDYDLVNQEVGIRPATYDRRPFLGRHPEKPRLACFNGLGTKGVSLSPYFSEHLAEHLTTDAPLITEVDIKRSLRRSKR